MMSELAALFDFIHCFFQILWKRDCSEESVANLEKAARLTEFDKVKLQTVIDKVLVYDEQHIEVVWKFEDFNQMWK